MELTLIPIGTRVKLWHDVDATVCGITLSGQDYGVSYKVAYWNGQMLVHEMVDDFLIDMVDENKEPLRVGFHYGQAQKPDAANVGTPTPPKPFSRDR